MEDGTKINNRTSRGVGFTGLLALVFITLKLCHVIAWSCWGVLSPLWASAAIAVLVVLLFLGLAIVAKLFD